MTTAAILAAALLPVIPQPSSWKPGDGECDISKAAVSESIVERPELGEEGYAVRIGTDGVQVVAGGSTGLVWARQTLAQLKVAGPKVRCGTIMDRPRYRMRGMMIDVGRMFHSMDFLRDLAKTLSYYKMNTLHIHLSDNEIVWAKKAKTTDWSRVYSAFRLECDTYPGLTARDGSYSKREFREFMLFCRSIGVTVIPEFDMPAHSLAFTRIKPEFASKKYGADHFDLSRSGEILAWVKPLFAEYLGGENPVFIGPYMHIGTDEYNKSDAESFRAFKDSMLKMVRSFGYRPCAWGSLTHAAGKTPVAAGPDITLDIWHNPYYQPADALKAGYTIVAIPDGLVYIVPFAGYYRDYLDCRNLYETWEPRNIAGYTVPDDRLGQLAGGKFALWNDRLGKRKDGSPYTEADNWDRIHPAVQTLSQKLWSGTRDDQPWTDFARLANSLDEPEGVKSTHKTRLDPGD